MPEVTRGQIPSGPRGRSVNDVQTASNLTPVLPPQLQHQASHFCWRPQALWAANLFLHLTPLLRI